LINFARCNGHHSPGAISPATPQRGTW